MRTVILLLVIFLFAGCSNLISPEEKKENFLKESNEKLFVENLKIPNNWQLTHSKIPPKPIGGVNLVHSQTASFDWTPTPKFFDQNETVLDTLIFYYDNNCYTVYIPLNENYGSNRLYFNVKHGFAIVFAKKWEENRYKQKLDIEKSNEQKKTLLKQKQDTCYSQCLKDAFDKKSNSDVCGIACYRDYTQYPAIELPLFNTQNYSIFAYRIEVQRVERSNENFGVIPDINKLKKCSFTDFNYYTIFSKLCEANMLYYSNTSNQIPIANCRDLKQTIN